jgi:hypothetical protein
MRLREKQVVRFGPFLTKWQRMQNVVRRWFGVQLIEPPKMITFLEWLDNPEAQRRVQESMDAELQRSSFISEWLDELPWQEIKTEQGDPA